MKSHALIFRDLLSFEKAPGSCSFCMEGRNVIRNSVSKRMSCDVDPFQRPALIKPMAGKGDISFLLASWAVASFLKDSPVSSQSVSWALSGKWRLEGPYLQLRDLLFNKAAVEKKFILQELPLLSHFPEDRQNVKKSFVFLLNLVVQTWKVNKKLAINNMKSFLTRKESRAALIN